MPEIVELNPTAIYKNKISTTINELQNKFLTDLSVSFVGLSENMDVLNSSVFSDLKKEVQSHIKWYETNICGFNDEMYLEITDSWYRETTSQQNHPLHNHPNSLISGVIYLNVPDQPGNHCGINFETNHHIFPGFNFEYRPGQDTKYNLRSMHIPVESGDIILFPSWIDHYVTKNLSQHPRKIISFNTFLKGTVSWGTLYPTTISLK